MSKKHLSKIIFSRALVLTFFCTGVTAAQSQNFYESPENFYYFEKKKGELDGRLFSIKKTNKVTKLILDPGAFKNYKGDSVNYFYRFYEPTINNGIVSFIYSYNYSPTQNHFYIVHYDETTQVKTMVGPIIAATTDMWKEWSNFEDKAFIQGGEAFIYRRGSEYGPTDPRIILLNANGKKDIRLTFSKAEIKENVYAMDHFFQLKGKLYFAMNEDLYALKDYNGEFISNLYSDKMKLSNLLYLRSFVSNNKAYLYVDFEGRAAKYKWLTKEHLDAYAGIYETDGTKEGTKKICDAANNYVFGNNAASLKKFGSEVLSPNNAANLNVLDGMVEQTSDFNKFDKKVEQVYFLLKGVADTIRSVAVEANSTIGATGDENFAYLLKLKGDQYFLHKRVYNSLQNTIEKLEVTQEPFAQNPIKKSGDEIWIRLKDSTGTAFAVVNFVTKTVMYYSPLYDDDGDGIVNYLDKCPQQKGMPEKDGCPLPAVPASKKTVTPTKKQPKKS